MSTQCKISACVFFLVVFLTGCKQKEAHIAEIEITTQGVKNFLFEDYFKIHIQQDTIDKILVRASEDMLPDIDYRLFKDWISFSSVYGGDFISGERIVPELFIHTTAPDTFMSLNSAEIYTTNILTDRWLYFIFYGDLGFADIEVANHHTTLVAWTTAGSYTLSGSCNWTYLYASGSATLDASSCITKIPLIVQGSVNDVKANATERVRAHIFNSGNVCLGSKPDSVEEYRLDRGRLIFNVE